MTFVRTGAAAVALAAASLLTLPVAASASIYPPAGSCTVSTAIASPGETFTLSCEAATFASEERVSITVTGENGEAASIGVVRFAITTADGVTDSEVDGSVLPVRITLPADAVGTYNIAAVSPSSAGGTAAVSVRTAASALPFTGLDAGSLAPLWIGGGVLLVAGAALAVFSALRRSRERD